MRWVIAVLALGALLAALERQAEACVCPPSDIERMAPADGTTDVPLNAGFLVVSSSTSEPVVEVLDATGAALPRAITSWQRTPYETWIWVRPEALLLPDATYSLSVDGEVRGTVTTGRQVDNEAPDFQGIAALSARILMRGGCSDSCWARRARADRVDLELMAPPDPEIPLLLLELSHDGEVFYTAPLDERTSEATLVSASCGEAGHAPYLVPETEICGRVLAHDLNGNVAGADQQVCTTVASCVSERCNVSDTCQPPPYSCSTGRRSGQLPVALAIAFTLFLPSFRRHHRPPATR